MEPLNLDNATPEIIKLVAGLENYTYAEKARALPASASVTEILDALISDASEARWHWREMDHHVSGVESEAEELLANL